MEQKNSALVFVYFSTSSKDHQEKLQRLCQEQNFFFERVETLQNREALQKSIALRDKKSGFVFYTPGFLSSHSFPLHPGKPNSSSGHRAFFALQEACDFALRFGCSGMLSLPLSKEWVIRSGKTKFRGHTDYLAKRFRSKVLMLMHGRDLSVIPLTVHIPLAKAAPQLKKVIGKMPLTELLKQVRQLPEYQRGNWALCGLNPHAGENGLIGSEEKFLKQFCQRLSHAGLFVDGPLAADALFSPLKRIKYRLILSCYHDQGLIPFKALEGAEGVNCTIGLPFLRTSPDHGPAFDLAGQKKADTRSMYRALELAVEGFSPRIRDG